MCFLHPLNEIKKYQLSYIVKGLNREGSNSYMMYRPSVQAKIKLWKMSSRQFNDASFHIELFINIFIIPRLRRGALQEGWQNGLKSML